MTTCNYCPDCLQEIKRRELLGDNTPVTICNRCQLLSYFNDGPKDLTEMLEWEEKYPMKHKKEYNL